MQDQQQQNNNEYFDLPSIVRLKVLQKVIKNKDKNGLHDWIVLNLNIDIPRHKICPDHDAPFDFVSDYLFGVGDLIAVVANRTGGKTMNFGILDTITSFLQPNTEIATVGAIQAQAQKCYGYFKQFSSEYPFNENIKAFTMSKTECLNGSIVQVLTGTMSGVNSPHPQLVFLDEIDLWIWQVLQQALSMAQSKEGVKARTVLTSTRKFPNGVMQRMITEAKSKGAKVYIWCVWEVVQKLPEEPRMLAEVKKVFGNSLPRNISKADGYYDWQDLITKYNTLDQEIWETEWLCKRPGLEGVVYGASYSDENNLISGDWKPSGKGYLYLFEDFGYGEGHPDVVLPVWIPNTYDRLIVFDELYMTGLGDDDIWLAVDNMLRNYNFSLPDRAASNPGNVRGWIPDPHGLTEIENRLARGAPMMAKDEDAQLYIVNNGIPLVRKLLQSGRLMISEKCVNLRLELLSYKRKKNADGTYSQIPEKKNDHGPDALRYGVIVLHRTLFQNAFNNIKQEIVEKQEERRAPVAPSEVGQYTDTPITAGLLNERF